MTMKKQERRKCRQTETRDRRLELKRLGRRKGGKVGQTLYCIRGGAAVGVQFSVVRRSRGGPRGRELGGKRGGKG